MKKEDENYKALVKLLGENYSAFQKKFMERKNNLSFQTICVNGMFDKEEGHLFKSIRPPLIGSSSSPFMDNLEAAAILSYDAPGFAYTRINNLTNQFLEMQMAMLEGYHLPFRTESLFTSSGMSAIATAIMSIVKMGDNIVSSNQVYGGTFQFFNVDLKNMGVEVNWVEDPSDINSWEKQIGEKTKLLFVESPSNPLLFVADIEELSKLASAHNIPLIVDNTMASPVLTRPLQYGADIVIESASKIICGSGRVIAGVLTSKDNINIKDPRPGLKENFAGYARGNLYRNMGPAFSPFNAEKIIDELITLPLRVKQQSDSALKVAKFLENHPKIAEVNYPGLESFKYHKEAKKYLKLADEGTNSFGFLLSFEVKGSKEATANICKSLQIGYLATDLGKSVTIFTHPATTTHFQLGDQERRKAGISDNLIRYSVGLENPEDLIKDLQRALEKV